MKMPILVRIWLAFSKYLAPLIHFWARHKHGKNGMDPNRFLERLGYATTSRTDQRWIWIHAASLGEVSQTVKVVAALNEISGLKIVVTTVTNSGADWVARNLPNAVHKFLPLDTPSAVNRFLDHWEPEAALFVEGDIWPRLILTTAERHIPMALINARPSKSREAAPKSYAYLLSRFAVITCKSTLVKDGLRKLGIAQENLFTLGDLRASAPSLAVNPVALSALKADIADRPVWAVASSHAEDEADIYFATKYVLEHQPDALLIWAPRHPERAKNIIACASDLVIHQRSKHQSITGDTQIYLADTLGELGTVFSCSKIVFLGGSFGRKGGHNPFEPASFGCFILTGPHIQNHKEGFEALMCVDAAKSVSNGADLGLQVVNFMDESGTEMNGENGRALVASANGSVEKTVALLRSRLAF